MLRELHAGRARPDWLFDLSGSSQARGHLLMNEWPLMLPEILAPKEWGNKNRDSLQRNSTPLLTSSEKKKKDGIFAKKAAYFYLVTLGHTQKNIGFFLPVNNVRGLKINYFFYFSLKNQKGREQHRPGCSFLHQITQNFITQTQQPFPSPFFLPLYM